MMRFNRGGEKLKIPSNDMKGKHETEQKTEIKTGENYRKPKHCVSYHDSQCFKNKFDLHFSYFVLFFFFRFRFNK